MIVNPSERKAFLVLLILVIALFVVIVTTFCVYRFRNRLHHTSTPPTLTTHGWWPFNKSSSTTDVEKAKPHISSPSGLRTLHLAEQLAVESSEKQTYAQAQRNTIGLSAAPPVYDGVGGSERMPFDRPARKWKRRNHDEAV